MYDNALPPSLSTLPHPNYLSVPCLPLAISHSLDRFL